MPGQSPAERLLPSNTNPLWERACSRKRWFSQHLYQPCHRLRSLAKARQLPQWIGSAWAISSRAPTAQQHQSPVGAGLPAKAVVQPTPLPAMPPPSQPRQSSTAPTRDWQCLGNLQPSAYCPATPIPCGSGLARESAGSANTSTSHATAFAASLKLDSSHSGLAVPGRSPAKHSLPSNTNHLWERACPRKRWFSQHLNQPCHRLRSLAKARQLPQWIGSAWAISSRTLTARQHQSPVGAGLPAKAVVQPTPQPAMPPPSQPR